MQIRKPSFYEAFRCIASACPDSCCKEWDVAVDRKTAAFYRTIPGELGDRLRFFLREEAGTDYLTLEHGRCPMWRQDGLCRIQAELGEDALCKTCRDFPRLTHDYGGFVELGLELSCPEAARILLGQEDWRWVQTGEAAHTDDYDAQDMDMLLRTRDYAMELTKREDPLSSLLMYGIHVQAQLDGAEALPFDPEDIPQAPGQGDGDALLEVFRNLEILTDSWRARLSHPSPRGLMDSDRAMLRYLISRYWLQAISDYDLVARVKLLVAAVLLVCLLGGDPVKTAQAFSKEIENDADNVDALLDGAYTLTGLTDANLLGLAKMVIKDS